MLPLRVAHYYTRNVLLKQSAHSISRSVKLQLCLSSANKQKVDKLSDEPVKFTGSPADIDAMDTFLAPPSNAPSYQSRIVAVSLSVFLIYFLILREENDVDDNLTDLFYAINPTKELNLLEAKLKQETEQGIDTRETLNKIAKYKSFNDQSSIAPLEATLTHQGEIHQKRMQMRQERSLSK